MPNFLLRPLAPHSAHDANRGLAGLLVTVFVHVALVLGWRMAREAPPAQAEEASSAIQWLHLPAIAPQSIAPQPIAPRPGQPSPDAEGTRARSRPAPDRAAHNSPVAGPEREPVPGPVVAPAASAPASPESAAAAPSAGAPPLRPGIDAIMESARRSVGSIDRALRKENRPLITAPPDSPHIRMRKGMEHAHELAPPRLWEAPKVEELVNNTGDGARRTRVITGNGSYCITERAPTTSIDMIEKHGKIRLTNCPQHEEPAKQQEWRTARD